MEPDRKKLASEEKKKILERVRKVLAKAGNNPSAEEAAAAASMAEQILAKYNLEFAEVQVEELDAGEGLVAEKVYANVNVGAAKKISDWAQWLAVATAEMFDCHCRLTNGEVRVSANVSTGARMVEFIGYETDVRVCAWTYGYFFQTLVRSSKVYTQKLNLDGVVGNAMKKPLQEFRQAASLVLCGRIRQLIAERDGRRSGDGTSTALVVLKRQKIDEQYGGFNYQQSGKELNWTDESARLAGAAAGARVDLNVRGVHGREASTQIAHG